MVKLIFLLIVSWQRKQSELLLIDIYIYIVARQKQTGNESNNRNCFWLSFIFILLQYKINNLIVATHGESPPNWPLQNVRTCESREEVPESKEKYVLCRQERASYLEMRVIALVHFWPMERDDVLVFLREASSISTGSSRSGSDCGGRSWHVKATKIKAFPHKKSGQVA